MPDVSDIIDYIAPISQYLASNDVSEGVLFGAPKNPLLPIQLYIETQAVKYRYDYEGVAGGEIPSESLIATSNYLYALCGRYGLTASALVASGGAVPSSGGYVLLYGYPISGNYTATTEGETVITLSLPPGAIVVQVFKSIRWLKTTEYTWAQPTLTLLGGNELSQDEELSYLYVVPV